MGGDMSVTLTETKKSISESELAQRVAVVRRFRELLEQQRERFRSYLAVLDKQQLLIGYGSADEIVAHVELEEQIVADIFSIQKVIDPLEVMYNAGGKAAGAVAGPYLPANDVPALKASLEDLKVQAAVRAGRNRDLLSNRLADINSEIQATKNNPFLSKARFSLYQNAAPSVIDVMG
jgi:hypothetical protein